MNDFSSAPASHSALFDNAPAVEAAKEYASTFGVSEEHARALIESATLQPAPAPAPQPICDYTDGVTAMWANGRTQRGRCRSDKVMTLEQARAALAQGALCVFVMTGDVEAVRGDGADR